MTLDKNNDELGKKYTDELFKSSKEMYDKIVSDVLNKSFEKFLEDKKEEQK